MPSTKRPVSPTFLINARGQLFRLTRTKPYLEEAILSRRTIGRWLRFVHAPTILWMAVGEDGTKKRNTRNGSAPTSRRKRGFGKRGASNVAD